MQKKEKITEQTPEEKKKHGRKPEDLSGRRFGMLTAVSRAGHKNGRTCWLCRCDCGNEKVVMSYYLKAGKAKSCGCLAAQEGKRRKDLTGRRFGRLTAVCPIDRRDKKGCVFWKCRCDCGNETIVTEDNLVQGTTRSCGCLKREFQQNIANQLHHVDGTCLELLEKRKYRKDNKSGFRGVFRTRNGRYRVDIGFKGRRYYVGTFVNYEEAVEARKEAEETVHNGFLNAYSSWKEKAESDTEWGKENPFLFEVEKINGQLVISTQSLSR